MANRSIRAGETLKLRARFRDDLLEPIEASSVYIHIFEPDTDTDNLSEAILVSGIPTYLGQGIYEYSYAVPDAGPEGAWHDSWQGESNTQSLDALFSFTVNTAGEFISFENQLFNNDIVQITIPSGVIAALDGTVLEDEYEYEFMITTSPSYTNVRKVRLEVGGFLGSIEDDTIQTSILEASIESDILTFTVSNINSALYQHAKREYVTCLASAMLVNNLGNMQLKSKTLGDLSVQYDTNGIRDVLNKLNGCMDKWLPQIIARGGAKAATQPSYVVKGANDPDRPAVGRMWDNRGGAPLANIKVRESGQRRYMSTYWPRSKRWW